MAEIVFRVDEADIEKWLYESGTSAYYERGGIFDGDPIDFLRAAFQTAKVTYNDEPVKPQLRIVQ